MMSGKPKFLLLAFQYVIQNRRNAFQTLWFLLIFPKNPGFFMFDGRFVTPLGNLNKESASEGKSRE